MKAIETHYNGYRFRSRTEARWAVFFDTLEMDWKYENEGYILKDGVRYLPDFWLPDLDLWVEIKGEEPSDKDWEKIYKLRVESGKDVLVLIGQPRVRFTHPLSDRLEAAYEGKLLLSSFNRLGEHNTVSFFERIRTLSSEHLQEQYEAGRISQPPPAFDGTYETWLKLIELDEEYWGNLRYDKSPRHPSYLHGPMAEECVWADIDGSIMVFENSGAHLFTVNYTDRLALAYSRASACRFDIWKTT